MKKLMLVLTLTLFALCPSHADAVENTAESVKPSIEINLSGNDFNKSVLVEFDTYSNLESYGIPILEELIDNTAENCTATATVTVSHTIDMEGNVGVASTGQQTTISISATVTASCSEIKGVVKQLIADLRKALGL